MGVIISYQALPAQSSLFDLLQSNPRIAYVYGYMADYGSGAFFWEEIDEEERDELLDDLADTPVFADRGAVDKAVAELDEALTRARREHPGIEDRSVSLEKSQSRIEQALKSILREKGNEKATSLVDALLYGARDFAPEAAEEYEVQGSIADASDVVAGAELLRELSAEELSKQMPDHGSYYREDYVRWRSFYLDAADRGDVVLVYAG